MIGSGPIRSSGNNAMTLFIFLRGEVLRCALWTYSCHASFRRWPGPLCHQNGSKKGAPPPRILPLEYEGVLHMLPEGGQGRSLDVSVRRFPEHWRKRATLMRIYVMPMRPLRTRREMVVVRHYQTWAVHLESRSLCVFGGHAPHGKMDAASFQPGRSGA